MTGPEQQTSFYVAASHRPAPQFIEVAQMVEELGFDGVSIADHLFVPAMPLDAYPYSDDGRPPFDVHTPWPDAFVLAGAAAAVTTRLRFVTGVYLLPLRHPLLVARAASTVDALAPGRLELGIGVGWMRDEFDVMGVDFTRRGRLTDESIGLLRKLWRGGLVEHDGPLYPMTPLHFEPHPVRPIPILVGGSSSRALERSARLGDGYIAAPSTADELLSVAAELRKLRVNFGRAGDPFILRARLASATFSADEYRRLIDAGVSSFVIAALSGSPSEVRGRLEMFTQHVIQPLRASGHRAPMKE